MAKDRPAKIIRYAQQRMKGVSRRRALKKAGYRPKSKASARSLAYKIEQRLVDFRGALQQQLLAVGVTPELLARRLRMGVDKPGEVGLKAVDRVLRIWDMSEAPTLPPSPLDAIDPNAKLAAIAALTGFANTHAAAAERSAGGTDPQP